MFIKSIKNSHAIACIVLLLLLFSCSVSQNGDNGAEKESDTNVDSKKGVPDSHNSQNALDWTGTYTGVIPCADCEGILTKISLSQEGSYQKSSVYLGKDSKAFTESGEFEWNEQGSGIILRPNDGEPSAYKVGEGYLQMLDKEGEVITGDFSDRYILRKNRQDERIEDKTWLLLELLGQKIDHEGARKTAQIELNSDLGRLSGNNGCNSIVGEYSLLENNRIQFGTMAGTRMACPEKIMEQAGKFNNVLAKTDNYTIKDNVLTLSKGKMAVLARFKLE